MSDSEIYRGVVRGNHIELDQPPGLPEGQEVAVILKPVARKLPPGEGIRRSAGAWSDDPEGLEKYLEWNRSQRKLSRPELKP